MMQHEPQHWKILIITKFLWKSSQMTRFHF